MLGDAAIAMWWDMESVWRDEFEDWHTHEHFPERLGIPGFLRGSRWASADGGDGFFVIYELSDYDTLTSPAYLARLNQPTTWSTRLMPHHRHMVRSQCRVLETAGAGLSRYALTLRFAPQPGREESLRHYVRQVAARIVGRPGLTAAHLLQTQTPAIAQTTEQAIRGGRDAAADWIFIATGYQEPAMRALCVADVSDDVLVARGALPSFRVGLYVLSTAATPADFERS